MNGKSMTNTTNNALRFGGTAEATVTGNGSVEATGSSKYAIEIISNLTGTVTIENGTYTSTKHFAVYHTASELIINGGEFISGGSKPAILQTAGTLKINGGTFTPAAGKADIQVNTAESVLDFTGHANPFGISIQFGKDISAENISLPEGFFLADANGDKVTGETIVAATYTVKGAPVKPSTPTDEEELAPVVMFENTALGIADKTAENPAAAAPQKPAAAPTLRAAAKTPSKGIAARTARPKL